VTPIQLIHAEAGIVMGGQFHTPHVFKQANETQLAQVKYYDDKPVEMKLTQTTIETVDYGMWGVVNEGGTAGSVGFPREINAGGKTGTAQVIAKEKARGKEHKDHSWFISFAPMHTDQKPEIGVVCITENGGWGAQASAPKAKIIEAAYFSKKLGRPILPELVAMNAQPSAGAADRKRKPVTQ
jgi:penicillin-binding protein 2